MFKPSPEALASRLAPPSDNHTHQHRHAGTNAPHVAINSTLGNTESAKQTRDSRPEVPRTHPRFLCVAHQLFSRRTASSPEGHRGSPALAFGSARLQHATPKIPPAPAPVVPDHHALPSACSAQPLPSSPLPFFKSPLPLAGPEGEMSMPSSELATSVLLKRCWPRPDFLDRFFSPRSRSR